MVADGGLYVNRIVQYRNEESIDRAVVELRDSELDGRRIYVRKVFLNI